MTKNEALELKNADTIAITTIGFVSTLGLEGVMIKKIKHNTDSYIYCVDTFDRVHRCKIYYNVNGDSFFRLYNIRIKLSACMIV